jgi:hypothetical protein
MPQDYAALTGSVGASLPEVRACLLLSRDGLPLAAHPGTEEKRAMDVWMRLAGLGEIDRGFAVVGPELWAFAHRGAFGALAIATAQGRPGLILDLLDRLLTQADEGRARRDPLMSGRETGESLRRPRPTLHRDARQELRRPATEVFAGEEARITLPTEPGDAERGPSRRVPESTSPPGPPELSKALLVGGPGAEAPEHPRNEAGTGSDRTNDVDAITLAREFAGLLEESEQE